MTAIFVQDLEERQVNVKLEAKESGSLTQFKGSYNFCSFFKNSVCFVNSQLWGVSGFLVMAFELSVLMETMVGKSFEVWKMHT